MKTEQKLALKLKELMSNEPLDQITVSRLTKVCGVNRQTFYYHFRDIYDLLTWIFLNESIQEIETASNYKEALYAFFTYIEKNHDFVKNVVSSAGRDLFIEFLSESLLAVQMRALTLKDTNKVLTLEDKRFIARFYNPAIISVFVRFVDTGMKDKKENVIKRLEILCDGYIDDAISKFEKSKKARN